VQEAGLVGDEQLPQQARQNAPRQVPLHAKRTLKEEAAPV